ncbi:MAG: glycine-rich protein, partial [Actinomycetota bacterium]|nr:glycine-rich protein [Actinomycetota bacterium]
MLGFAAFFGSAAVANATITEHYGEEDTATFLVPPGVTSIQVVAVGGRGGRNGGSGTVGAKVTGTFSVTPGASLGINVAGSGTNCRGGKNGGGSVRIPCQQSGGGGGASDIRTAAGLNSRIMVAAGGGGWGGSYGAGGAAGGNAGAAGTSDCVKQAQPGTQSAGGAAGGTCELYNPATSGSLGQGGMGGNYLFTPDYAGDSGGGGGGGLYGGGGASAGGGAGGSSLTSSGGTIAVASEFDNPYIDITYSGSTLNVSTSGTGSGFITSTPAGIDCGRNVTGHSDCSQEFPPGEEVTLEANGGLSGYTGCSSAEDQVCTITMDQNRTVTG